MSYSLQAYSYYQLTNTSGLTFVVFAQICHSSCRHQVKQYTVKVAREGQEDEEEVQEEVQAVVGPGQKLESSPPLLQPEEQALGRKSEVGF